MQARAAALALILCGAALPLRAEAPLSAIDFLREKGLSSRKKSTQTAKISRV